MVEKISAVTLRVTNMRNSVRLYRDVLGLDLLYGGKRSGFTSLRAKDGQSAILNLEQGRSVTGWGRMIFYVSDVDGSGRTFGKRDFIQIVRKMRHGVSDIFM